MIFLMFSCNSVSKPSVVDPHDMEWPESEVNQYPLLSTAEMAQGLNIAFESLSGFNADLILLSYDNALSHGDSYCPLSYEIDGNSLWYGGCSTEDGTKFDGYLFTNQYEEHDIFGDGTLWYLDAIAGSANITFETGDKIHWGGNCYYGDGINIDGHSTALSLLEGSFMDETMDEEWLKYGQSLSLLQHALQTQDGSNSMLLLDGAVPSAPPLSGVQFVDVLIEQNEWNVNCPMAISGELGLRDEYGNWYDLSFEGGDGRSCDGCGNVLNGTDTIGQLCIDINVLLNSGIQTW